MDKNAEQVLVATTDVALNRVECVVMRWAQLGRTASFVGCLGRKFGFIGPRSVRPSTSRPWLRQKKGRAAN